MLDKPYMISWWLLIKRLTQRYGKTEGKMVYKSSDNLPLLQIRTDIQKISPHY